MRKNAQNPREVAEIVAIQALGHIAQDGQLLGAFLSETGIGPQTLRQSASDPAFLCSVLDFILRDDVTVTGFSTASGHHPTTVVAARQAMGDADLARRAP